MVYSVTTFHKVMMHHSGKQMNSEARNFDSESANHSTDKGRQMALLPVAAIPVFQIPLPPQHQTFHKELKVLSNMDSEVSKFYQFLSGKEEDDGSQSMQEAASASPPGKHRPLNNSMLFWML